MPDGRIPFGAGTPNRGTSEAWLDDWNQQFRQSSIYQNFMRRYGLPTDGRVQLSREQQSALEAELRAAGMQIPSGMHIDQGGNLNQKNRLVRNSLIGAGIAGGGLAALGAAGIGPFSGLGAGATTSGALEASAGGATLPAAATEGMLPMSVAGGAGAGAAGAGALGAAGAGAARTFLGMTPSELAGLGLGVGGAIGGALQDKPNFSANTMTQDPQLQKLLATMQGRLDKSEPLYDSIMAMANGLLPMSYQKGGGGMR